MPAPRAWIPALSATLLLQTVGTFLSQSIPVVAPRLTADLGLRPEVVGNLASLNTLGAILFLLVGTPFLARFGAARMLQAGALTGAAALALVAAGQVWLLPLAGLLMGFGYGPTGPAGSRILQATAPPRHRVLIFSVKQAGAPAGAVLAGLVTAPLAAAWGWQAALGVGIGTAVAAALAIEPLRRRLDTEAPKPVPLREALRPKRLALPLATLRLHPVLPPLCAQAFAFAALQGCLMAFTVTWLVEAHGMTLTAAGTLSAVLGAAGVAGRLALGWVADRLGDATASLAAQGLAAAVMAAAWVLAGPAAAWPLALALAFLAGFLVLSWNGIFLAEVARVVPADRVAEASAGAILLCFMGYLVAPSAFAFGVGLTGGWRLPWLAMCAVLAAVSAAVWLTRRRGRADDAAGR